MPDPITELLRRVRTIAVIGLTSSQIRPAYGVSAYMQRQGYRIIPINPKGEEVLGERGYKNLREVPEPVDIVDVFRRADAVPEIMNDLLAYAEATHTKPALWLQEGIVHEEAAARARAAGHEVYMGRCILKEHRKRARELKPAD